MLLEWVFPWKLKAPARLYFGLLRFALNGVQLLGSVFLRSIMGMGVLFRIRVCAGLDQFGHGARNYVRIWPKIRIAPKSSDHLQSRCTDIAPAIDWLVRLHHPFLDGMRLTRFVVY